MPNINVILLGSLSELVAIFRSEKVELEADNFENDWTHIQVYINNFSEPLFSYDKPECE